MENRILSNINYTIHNYSNYDISLEETKDIIDVPYFPAQNLVEVQGIPLIEVKDASGFVVDRWLLLQDQYGKDRVFALLNKQDQRFLFVELADNARYLQYRFGGTTYPQGRQYHTITTDGRKVYIAFGECNNRCVDDLWEYDIYTNTWKNLNYHIQEQSINVAPSKRRKANVVVLPSEIWVFGGETDILKIHSDSTREIIPLNDVWKFDKNTGQWENFDKQRILPHRPGNIVYIDNSVIKIYIQGGINEVGEQEPDAIWEINRETDEVTYTPVDNFPFVPSYTNQALFIDGAIHYLVNGNLYRWDNDNNQFVLVKENITNINPINKNYLIVKTVVKDRGGVNDIAGTMNVTEAYIHNFDDDSLLSTKTITPPIDTKTIPSVNIGNYQTWYMYGVFPADNGYVFNEDIFVLTHQTLQTEKIELPETEKPQERIYPSLCYDRYRNRIWLFGGTDGTKFYNDLWYFDLNTRTWTKVFDVKNDADNETYPAPRQQAGMAVVVNGDFLYLIGGYSDTAAFNDMWQLNLKTMTWQKVYLTDNIPFGSQYFIFEWRDRLFLFNGEVDGVYRFFYQNKQFVKQPFVFPGYVPDNLKKLISQKQFLETPIDVKVIDDYLFIQNNQVNMRVNLYTREVEELQSDYGVVPGLTWLDYFKAFNPSNGNMIYINVSKLYPLTKNQIPLSYMSKHISLPINSGVFIKDYLTNTSSKIVYYDQSGTYRIQGRVLPKDKAQLLVDGEVSIVGTQNDYPDVDFTNKDSVWQKTIEVMMNPLTYPFEPWFLYNKGKPPVDYYKGLKQSIYDERRKRLFLVYESGNIVKLNLNDFTLFTYYPRFWAGSVIAYNKLKGKFWCFGGLRRNDREPYTQYGFKCEAIETECIIEMSHCGVVELDINVNELSLRSIQDYQREHNASLVDYSITRDYLISLISKYLEQYEQNRTLLSLEEIKKRIYTATQSLVDDLSTTEIVYEKGNRPRGRAFSAYAQIDNKVYIFGGCQCYQKKGIPPKCVPIIKNAPYHTTVPGTLEGLQGDDLEKQGKLAVYYDLEKDEWVEIEPLPEWRYMASAIVSPDNRYIYIVGGYTGANCTNPSNEIIRYDTVLNKYEKLQGIPDKFSPRALPILYWLDDYRLLIMYGSIAKLNESEDGMSAWYQHTPVPDAWILDTKSKIMYKAFEDLISFGLAVRDYYAKDEIDELKAKRSQFILLPVPIQLPDGNVIIRLIEHNLTNGEVTVHHIQPDSEIMTDINVKIVDDEFGGELKPTNQ